MKHFYYKFSSGYCHFFRILFIYIIILIFFFLVIFELSWEYGLKRNYLSNGKILAVANINTKSQVFETTNANIRRRHPSTEMTWLYIFPDVFLHDREKSTTK